MTLLTVFYSLFVGTVWGGIPSASQTESMTWRHLLPLYILVALMMVSASMSSVPSSEFIALTAMALIHVRAGVLSVTRLGISGLGFTIMQGIGFFLVIADLFQANLLSFSISKTAFLILITMILVLSVAQLIWLKRKINAKSKNEVGSHRVDSGMLS